MAVNVCKNGSILRCMVLSDGESRPASEGGAAELAPFFIVFDRFRKNGGFAHVSGIVQKMAPNDL